MGKIRPTNAEILARRLKAIGVRYVFGIPSGQILAAVEALEACGIRFVLVSQEMSAAFMADVIGRLTGVPGVALATLGPGATNLTTGVGNALLDRSPCLIVTGQVPSGQFGRRVQMHVDHQQLFRPLTKGSFLLAPGRILETLDRAVRLALAEPPGPVHLDLLEDFALDREPADADSRVRVAAELTGGLGTALDALDAAGLGRTAWDLETIRRFRVRLAKSLRPASRRFQPHQVVDLLRAWLPASGILTCDVGAHTHIVAAQWPVPRSGTLLVSNGWSSMGYAIPAALAAKLARPRREVACIVGDGGFLMQAGEMATAARLGCRVLFVVLRDASLSLIRAKQERRRYRSVGVVLESDERSAPADYFGVPCLPARSAQEFRTALRRAARRRGPVVIEAVVDGSRYGELLYA